MYLIIPVCVCVCVQLLRYIQFFVTTWALAHQASLSMEFSMPRILEWLPFPFPGALPDPGSKLCLLGLQHWQVDPLPFCHLGSPHYLYDLP